MKVKIYLSPEFGEFTLDELAFSCPGIFNRLKVHDGEPELVSWDGKFESLPENEPVMIFINFLTGLNDTRMGEFVSRCQLREHFIFANGDYVFDRTSEPAKYQWSSLKRFLGAVAKKIVIPPPPPEPSTFLH